MRLEKCLLLAVIFDCVAWKTKNFWNSLGLYYFNAYANRFALASQKVDFIEYIGIWFKSIIWPNPKQDKTKQKMKKKKVEIVYDLLVWNVIVAFWKISFHRSKSGHNEKLPRAESMSNVRYQPSIWFQITQKWDHFKSKSYTYFFFLFYFNYLCRFF